MTTCSREVGSTDYRNIVTEETLKSYIVYIQHVMHLNDLVTNHTVAQQSYRTRSTTQIQGCSQITWRQIILIL